jgi:hypothetical protein
MKPQESGVKGLERLAKWMDSQFRIPGTDIRFGLDAIIGLIPGGGDFVAFIVSAFMLSMLAKRGASGYLLARMAVNILIDALIGAVPIFGDIFDVAFKANERNIKLMKEYNAEGKHTGSALKLIIPLLIVLAFVIGLIGWISYRILSWLFHLL